MSVQSETFDLLFDYLQNRQARLGVIQKNYTRAEGRLEVLSNKPATAARQKRIDGIIATQAWRLEQVPQIEDTITRIDSALPKDEFVPSFWVNDDGENYGVSVTITDSPYDDTYVGGSPFRMRLSGRYCTTGSSGYSHTRGVFTGPTNGSDTIGFSSTRLNGEYSTTVSLLYEDTFDTFYSQQIIDSDGVQLI